MPKKTLEIYHLCPDTNGDPKVSVYLRELSKSGTYYARYKIDRRELANGQRFITESLKTDNLEQALEKAKVRYAAIKFAQESGIGLKDLNVEEGILKFIGDYEKKVIAEIAGYSKHMLASYKIYLQQYWTKFIGSKQLNTINFHDLDGYEVWRKTYAKERFAIRKGHVPETIARTTIRQEIGSFKHCLRWLKEHNFYHGTAQTYRYRVGNRPRRSAFTIEQYEKLVRFMRRNDFLKRAKRKLDLRHERYRQMLRAYVLFMANTGLRVGEARHLKWEDIEERSNKIGQPVVVVRVSASRSKVKKSRQTVGRATALRALQRWQEYLASIGEANSPSTFIFCDEYGHAIHSFGVGFNSLIKNAGVEQDGEGRKHTIYSLRHTYITFRLMFGKNINIYHLAENCGTSVDMIQEYYSDARPTHFVDELSI